MSGVKVSGSQLLTPWAWLLTVALLASPTPLQRKLPIVASLLLVVILLFNCGIVNVKLPVVGLLALSRWWVVLAEAAASSAWTMQPATPTLLKSYCSERARLELYSRSSH